MGRKYGSRYIRGRKRMHKIQWIAGVTAGLFLVFLCTIMMFQGLRHQKEAGSDKPSALRLSSGSIQSSSLHSDTQPDTDNDWKLMLVNRWHKIPEGYQPELTQLRDGHAVDSRIYPELQKMFDDARNEGILPKITSSFRTAEDQQRIMDEKISEYRSKGYADDEAKEIAEKWVAAPGTSEHQIGMAVDISTADENRQDASTVWRWLNENSYKYGFILRYPEDKTEITGVMHERWHYRYVGKEAANEIYMQNICLEEYLENFPQQ